MPASPHAPSIFQNNHKTSYFPGTKRGHSSHLLDSRLFTALLPPRDASLKLQVCTAAAFLLLLLLHTSPCLVVIVFLLLLILLLLFFCFSLSPKLTNSFPLFLLFLLQTTTDHRYSTPAAVLCALWEAGKPHVIDLTRRLEHSFHIRWISSFSKILFYFVCFFAIFWISEPQTTLS